MGLSFHYSGRFKPGASLPAMIAEVKDIAEIYKWRYHIYEPVFPPGGFDQSGCNQKVYGISFIPPGCETVWLCFLSNGKMSSPAHLQFYGNSKSKEEREYLYSLSVKTQFAGIETHAMVIHLLKHLEKKYFRDFKVNDEGGYWETGKLALLQDAFSRYNNLAETVSSSFKHYQPKPGEDPDSYFERILKTIHEKYKK